MAGLVVRVLLFGLLAVVLLDRPRAVRADLRDGFNLYKDYLRGKGDFVGDYSLLRDELATPKFLYFYRASPGVIPISEAQATELLNKKSLLYGKRDLNQFKNYMLTREPPEMQFTTLDTRSGGAFLAAVRQKEERPIPVRSSILLAKRDIAHTAEEEQEAKRASFVWSGAREPTRIRADLSDYYRMTTPSPLPISLVERLTSKSAGN